MISIRLLADDLTGALDTMAEFATPAAGPLHAFWHGGVPGVLPASAAVDTGTREADEAQARCRVTALAPMLAAGTIAFKKVDSLIRGHTLAELRAVAGFDTCVFAPAFPGQGRITRGGQQFMQANGGWCPVGPNLVDALGARPGVPGAAPGPGITVFDAEDDVELDQVAAAAGDRRVLWCGTAGLAAALGRRLGGGAACPPLLPRPILGLFGSDQAATFAQLRACAPHWLHWAERTPHDLAARLAAGLALVSIDLPPGLARDLAAGRIGAALHGLARAVPRPGTLLVAGGETLRGLCLALGATSLELEGRILPGLPRAVLRGGDWDGVTIVSKSGAFGPAALLRDLLASNGFFLERTS